jgi:hypothetical protein
MQKFFKKYFYGMSADKKLNFYKEINGNKTHKIKNLFFVF